MRKSIITFLTIIMVISVSSAWATDYLKRGTVTCPYARYNHNINNQNAQNVTTVLLEMITNSSEHTMQFHIDLYDMAGNPVGRFPEFDTYTINGHGSFQIDWNSEFAVGNPNNLDPTLEECSSVIVWKGKIDTPPVVLADLITLVDGVTTSNSISIYQSQH